MSRESWRGEPAVTWAADSALQSLSDASEIGIVLLDGAGRVTLWNAWMAKASGIDTSWAMGCELAEIFPGLAGSRISSAVTQALTGGLSAMLSSSLNKALFPLLRESPRRDAPDPMHQIVGSSRSITLANGRAWSRCSTSPPWPRARPCCASRPGP